MPERPQKPERPNILDLMRLAAEKGDISSLQQWLGGPDGCLTTPELREHLIQKCIESAAQGGPAALVDRVIDHLIRHDTRLLINAQISASRLEDKRDASFVGNKTPDERYMQALERAGRIADRVLHLAQVRARLCHLEDLANQGPKAHRNSEKIVKLPERPVVQGIAGG